MKSTTNILRRLNQLESLAGLILNEATMLKQELPGVVSGNSPKRENKVPKARITKAIGNRALTRVRKQ